jgi:hypothetical protein
VDQSNQVIERAELPRVVAAEVQFERFSDLRQ